MFVALRTIIFASLFVSLVLIYVPANLLAWKGIVFPAEMGEFQVAGMLLGVTGALMALWCVVVFAAIGKGTPAPFDPPRRLVIRGPYRLVRNPMYVGAGMALGGAALFYETWIIVAYLACLALITHLFVIGYEEPTLRRLFGKEYDDYCARVPRWTIRIG